MRRVSDGQSGFRWNKTISKSRLYVKLYGLLEHETWISVSDYAL